MATPLTSHGAHDLVDFIRVERRGFAAMIRMARAMLGWSQSELGLRVGLTQRAIHKLEQGETEPRRATIRAIEAVWRKEGIEFACLTDGGFSVIIRAALIDRPLVAQSRRPHPTPAALRN
jgi:transcriptional regulator with XRE-family HTH domain